MPSWEPPEFYRSIRARRQQHPPAPVWPSVESALTNFIELGDEAAKEFVIEYVDDFICQKCVKRFGHTQKSEEIRAHARWVVIQKLENNEFDPRISTKLAPFVHGILETIIRRHASDLSRQECKHISYEEEAGADMAPDSVRHQNWQHNDEMSLQSLREDSFDTQMEVRQLIASSRWNEEQRAVLQALLKAGTKKEARELLGQTPKKFDRNIKAILRIFARNILLVLVLTLAPCGSGTRVLAKAYAKAQAYRSRTRCCPPFLKLKYVKS